MNLFKRLLAASGAAGLLIGLGGATQAFATGPEFTGEILLGCATVGDTQKISVTATGDALIHIEVTIDGSKVNGGTQNGTGLTDANHTFNDQWTVASVAANTTAAVRVWALSASGVTIGDGTFDIHPATAPCATPPPSSLRWSVVDTQQVGGDVQKTCDAGVSGSAVFAATIHIIVSYQSSLSTTITLPASLALTLECNGPSKSLPVLPVGSTITLHESTLPTGAAAPADDTTITIAVEAPPTTIHNAKAAVVTTPTPTPTPVIVLPATGQPASTPGIPWPALALLGLIAIAGAGLVLRRRS